MTDPHRFDPHRAGELTRAARALLVGPLRRAEADPEVFGSIRRHAETLDRWFTQRLGYRLVVGADTARLVKSGYLPADRPLRTPTGRAFTVTEYTALALVLAATASGPDRISLRDLVLHVRSAAADAGIRTDGSASERRALVTALRWLIEQGMVRELDRSVAGYERDADADALLEIRNDRLAMLPTAALVGSGSTEELLERATDRSGSRAALRRRLVEDPVLYAQDVEPEEWAELRRRAGEEARFAEEMFAFALEVRAEGYAAIDVDGGASDVPFPTGGTTGHAALLLLATLAAHRSDAPVPAPRVRELLDELVAERGRYWRKDAVEAPDHLLAEVLDLLAGMRLVAVHADGAVSPLPAAARYAPQVSTTDEQTEQEALL